MDDERFYTEVMKELNSSGPMPGLWAKAYAESGGNESQAKALYLRYRVEQLVEAERYKFRATVESNNEEDGIYSEIRRNFSAHAPFLAGIALLIVLVIVVYTANQS